MVKVVNFSEITEHKADYFTSSESTYDIGGPVKLKDNTTETVTLNDQSQNDLYSQSVNPEIAQGTISTKELYPFRDELNPILSTAFQLLDEGNKILSEALQSASINEYISSDDAMLRFQALLPELFCCRNIGDGFGIIISAIYQALKNHDDIPLKVEQINIILLLIKRLSVEPYIDFNDAVNEVMVLEDLGFDVNPSHFCFASDWLSE